MHLSFSTRDATPGQERRYWRDAIGRVYFHLQLETRTADAFSARVRRWNVGELQLSRLESAPVRYLRLREDCRLLDRQILVTLPMHTPVAFTQLGRTVECQPGRFLIEHSDEPYAFEHDRPNDMWVLKLPAEAIETRVGNISRFCAQPFDCASGIGRLFADYLHLLTRHCDSPLLPQADDAVRGLMSQQLLDLLAVTLNAQPDAVHSTQSAVRRAHLARIRAYVQARIGEPDLDPSRIAQDNGISLRYLHALFREDGVPVAQWVRNLRLELAMERLRCGSSGVSVSQVAYDLGFSDPAYFSHAFRKRFGHSPSEARRPGRADD